MPDPQSVESMSVSINDTRDDSDMFTIPVQKSAAKQKKTGYFVITSEEAYMDKVKKSEEKKKKRGSKTDEAGKK